MKAKLSHTDKETVSMVETPQAILATNKYVPFFVSRGDIVVLKEGTRFYNKGEQWLVYQTYQAWKHHMFTSSRDTITKYVLFGNGKQLKVDLDEIDYIVRNIDEKKKAKSAI